MPLHPSTRLCIQMHARNRHRVPTRHTRARAIVSTDRFARATRNDAFVRLVSRTARARERRRADGRDETTDGV